MGGSPIKVIEAGTRFGHLTCTGERVISPFKDKGAAWKCICDCGRETIALGKHLHRKLRSRKCCGVRGCPYMEEYLKTSEKSIKHISERKTEYTIYRHGASNRGLEFTLTKEEFHHITLQPCRYCGEFDTNKIKNKGKERMNGIDRVDNTIGYILENCVSCCKVCNFMKGKLSIETFMKQCRKIVDKEMHLRDSNSTSSCP